jgi:long-chain acyl-CoA synthetase
LHNPRQLLEKSAKFIAKSVNNDTRIMTDPIAERLTAPGAPFEFEDIELDGVPCRVFRNTPRYLSTLFENLGAFADKTFAVYEDRRLTYAQVESQAAALATYLRDEHGIGRQDRVAIAMRNAPEWLVAFLAITSLGAVAVLVNSRGTPDDIAYCLTSTKCKLAIADRRCASGLDQTDAADIPCLVTDVPVDDTPGTGSLDEILGGAAKGKLGTTDCDPSDEALILFTSGTTGRPKGAVLTHRGVMTALRTNEYSSALIGAQMAAQYGIDLETLAANRPQLCTLLMFPLFHVSGCHSVLLPSLIQGGKIVFMKRWDAERALRLVESEKITTFPGVPTMHWDLLQLENRNDFDLSSMSSMSIAGQATPLQLLEAVRGAFPTAVVGTGYGMTETNGAVALIIGDDFLAAPGCAGRPVATTEIRLRGDDGEWVGEGESGEICVRGATVMKGYDNKPEANAEAFVNGWFRTGDVGLFDEEGRIYIVDRQTDMVISGGENIYCAEIERVFLEHPAVLEAATFGVPDDRLGEKVIALVRYREGQAVETEAIEAFLGERLAAYKLPKVILRTDAPLPRNPAGKALKPQMREEYLATQEGAE